MLCSQRFLTLFASVVVLTAGCTRSLEVRYTPGFGNDSALRATSKERVAIAEFADARAWVFVEVEGPAP